MTISEGDTVVDESSDEAKVRYLPHSFAIVGVQKAATSTLYGMLVRHRAISGAGTKEKHFFNDERMDWSSPNYGWYRTRAKRPGHTTAGDATPAYLYWPQALERMHAYNADMKLIGSFRDPIERAFSHWSLERGRTPQLPDFDTIVSKFRPEKIPDGFPPGGGGRRRFKRGSIVGRGLYGQQLRRGYSVFPREQWLCVEFRSVFGDPEGTLDRVTDFLELPRFEKYPGVGHKNATAANHEGVPPTGEGIADLARFYADDLAEFAELSGVDTSGWSTVRILAGDLDPAELADKLGRRAGLIR